METRVYRHGEIVFEVIKSLPKGLKKSSSKEFLKGSHGHPHSFNKGNLYLKNENECVFGYFKAKDTTLYHAEHGAGNGELKEAKLPDDIYCLRRGVEYINGDLKQIID